MSDPYLGEIQAFPFPFAVGGFNQAWMPCGGQLLPISQYAALYSLIGTLYGGNGTTNFQLPNMTGTVSNSQGAAPGLQPRIIGSTIGSASVTLSTQEMAIHTHGLQLGSKTAAGATPGPGTASNTAAIDPSFNGFVVPPNTITFAMNAVTMTGGGQSHSNTQPTQAIVWCIAYNGIFPSFGES
jgi:microcystin-dependent protein